jgi:hypothetical protein
MGWMRLLARLPWLHSSRCLYIAHIQKFFYSSIGNKDVSSEFLIHTIWVEICNKVILFITIVFPGLIYNQSSCLISTLESNRVVINEWSEFCCSSTTNWLWWNQYPIIKSGFLVSVSLFLFQKICSDAWALDLSWVSLCNGSMGPLFKERWGSH